MMTGSEGNTSDTKCLEYSLEVRKERMAQDIEELRHFCQQIARFPDDVKVNIKYRFSRAIISQQIYKMHTDLIQVGICLMEYSYLNSDYLVAENYDDIYTVWKEFHDSVDNTIKTIRQLEETNFFHEENTEGSEIQYIRDADDAKEVIFPAIEDGHKQFVVNGNAFLHLLYKSLIGFREILERVKNGSIFIEERFDSIYEANYLLYRKEYWPNEGRSFRQHIEAHYFRGRKPRVDILEDLLKHEKYDFENCDTGLIWRDYFFDKKDLYFKMKNGGIDESQWIYFFNHICRFEEFEKWIDEIEHPHVEENEYPESDWDKIFKDTIDVKKIKGVLPSLLPDSPSIPNWFVVHKIFEEIDWLQDAIDTHFISWVRDVYGWGFQTFHFKSVNPALKKKHSMDWNVRTMTAASVVQDYITLADKIRNEFVKKMEGKTVKVDNTYYFKRPDLYIDHRHKS